MRIHWDGIIQGDFGVDLYPFDEGPEKGFLLDNSAFLEKIGQIPNIEFQGL